jgi:two-component system, sensor histidine kinase LadS
MGPASLRVAFSFLLAMFCLSSLGAQAAAAAPAAIVIGKASRVDLSSQVEWCRSAPDTGVAAIAAGGCRFAPAAAGDLMPGYSRDAYWLRMTLANSDAAPVDRWLRIGHPRLEQVSFFEAVDGGWRRSDSGLSVAAARRPAFAVDPLLPLRLAPGEQAMLLVRVASHTTIDLTPTLWEPQAYGRADTRFVIAEAMGIGGLFIVALLSLLIWARSRNRLYLYFAGNELGKMVFMGAFSTLWQTVLWPEERPFDIRLIALGAGCAPLFYILFIRSFVGEFQRNRVAHGLLLFMGGITAVAMLWAMLIEYRAVQIILPTSTLTVIAGTYLFHAAWRRGSSAAGYMVVANLFFLLIQGVVVATNFGGTRFSDLTISLYVWGSLLGSPLILIGLAVQSEDLRDRLTLAQAESAARVEFLARMSHELRTPLDTILGTAQLLARPEGQARFAAGIEDITNSGWRLLRMIDDILDYARGIAGRLGVSPRPVDWPVFLRRLEANARRLAERNGNAFSLRADAADVLCFDEGRLRQVLDNLLVNAARHTQDGLIRLDCAVSPADEDGQVRLDFAVTDSGEGVAPEDRERIFRPFERGGRSARQGGKGIGMGLAIARQLVEMMGGQIAVEGAPERGACFRFHILAEVAATAGAETAAEVETAAGYAGRLRSVLVVDDEADNRRIVATVLREQGFAVTGAASGQAAADLCSARAEAFDLILTDQFMADGDGWSVLAAAARQWPEAPVVLMSAAPPEPPKDFPAGIDFAAHLMKPLDHARLLDHIAELLRLDRRQPPADAPKETPSISLAHRPDPEALQTLRVLIDTGQITGIQEWATALVAREPQCAAFAEAIHAAATGLDFSQLDALAGDNSVHPRNDHPNQHSPTPSLDN